MRLATVTLCVILSITAFAGQVVSDDDVDADYYFSRGQHYDGEQNYPEAAKWYLKAAELGHAGAQLHLGVLYFKGHGVQQDYAKALKWARMAADQGLATAQASIGYVYHSGKGASQNYVEAEKWYLLAANQGHYDAMIHLSTLYDEQRKYVKALAWCEVAMVMSDNVYQRDDARDLCRSIKGVRGDKATGDQVDQAGVLANSLLQKIN